MAKTRAGTQRKLRMLLADNIRSSPKDKAASRAVLNRLNKEAPGRSAMGGAAAGTAKKHKKATKSVSKKTLVVTPKKAGTRKAISRTNKKK